MDLLTRKLIENYIYLVEYKLYICITMQRRVLRLETVTVPISPVGAGRFVLVNRVTN